MGHETSGDERQIFTATGKKCGALIILRLLISQAGRKEKDKKMSVPGDHEVAGGGR
jgi:hypothetical protein